MNQQMKKKIRLKCDQLGFGNRNTEDDADILKYGKQASIQRSTLQTVLWGNVWVCMCTTRVCAYQGIKPLLWPCRLFPACRMWKKKLHCYSECEVPETLNQDTGKKCKKKKNQTPTAVFKLSLAQPSLIHIGSFLIQQLHTTQNSKFSLQSSLVVLFSQAQS